MAAPLKNQNHLKYTPEKVKKLLQEAIKITEKEDSIFNYPSLHKSIGLDTLRTLPYLAEKYKNNPELIYLWEILKTQMRKNMEKHIEQFTFERQFKSYCSKIELISIS